MRSGTNQFHGTAYEFLRNTDLNAIGYIFGQRPATFEKPTLQRNQFGATVGGPIIKNKLFFFGDYEGFRQLQRYLNFDSIPTLTDRAGHPAGAGGQSAHRRCLSGEHDSDRRSTPFAATGAERLCPRRTAPGRANNYQKLAADARLQRQVRRQDRRPDQRQDDRLPALQPAQGHSVLPARPSRPLGRRWQRLSCASSIRMRPLGYTWTVTPTSLLEVRLGFSHILGGKFPPFLGGASMQCSLRNPRPADLAQSHRRPQHAEHQRLHRRSAGRPPIRNSRIRPRGIPKINYSLDARAGTR